MRRLFSSLLFMSAEISTHSFGEEWEDVLEATKGLTPVPRDEFINTHVGAQYDALDAAEGAHEGTAVERERRFAHDVSALFRGYAAVVLGQRVPRNLSSEEEEQLTTIQDIDTLYTAVRLEIAQMKLEIAENWSLSALPADKERQAAIVQAALSLTREQVSGLHVVDDEEQDLEKAS